MQVLCGYCGCAKQANVACCAPATQPTDAQLLAAARAQRAAVQGKPQPRTRPTGAMPQAGTVRVLRNGVQVRTQRARQRVAQPVTNGLPGTWVHAYVPHARPKQYGAVRYVGVAQWAKLVLVAHVPVAQPVRTWLAPPAPRRKRTRPNRRARARAQRWAANNGAN